jgi:hypothetical protein
VEQNIGEQLFDAILFGPRRNLKRREGKVEPLQGNSPSGMGCFDRDAIQLAFPFVSGEQITTSDLIVLNN